MNKNLNLLKDYYKSNHIPLILNNEIKNSEDFARIFIQPLDAIEEFSNFKKVFLEYLPYYVYQPSMIETFILDNIQENLVHYSKKCKELGLIPRRKPTTSGIYGEVYTDLYGRVYKECVGITSYINRRGYDNNEVKGCDDFLVNINDGIPEFIFSESKFVADLYKATNALIDDINGTPNESPHLEKGYLNRFTNFILNKVDYLNSYESEVLRDLINEINSEILHKDKSFIDIINEKEITAKFIYFAIFNSEKVDIEYYVKSFNKIKLNFEDKIKGTGILKYSLDIVFIPIINIPMNVRIGIDDEY